MATISLYASKINNMPGLIKDVKKSVKDYKSELSNLRNKSLQVNKSICDLDEVISSISTSTKTQEEKIESLEIFQNNSEQFITDTVKIDSDVADIVNQNKDDFYNKYYYLKPECEKSGWEKFCDGCKKVGEWCKEHWVMITTIFVVIAVAVIAVVTFGVAVVAIAAIAGIVSLVLCVADVICMIATGGKGISDLCRENGMGWLGEIFDGISVGCDIVSIVFPAGAAIKTMAKIGVKAFVKGSIQAAKFAFKETIEKVFKSGFKNGVKNFGKLLFKTFIFDIDDFSRVNSSGKRVFDIYSHATTVEIKPNAINYKGLNPDGTVAKYPELIDGYPDGFDGPIKRETLEPGTRIDRYGHFGGSFVAPEGISFESRALPPESKKSPYTIFEVVEPIEANGGRIASWFNQPGGGIQYKFDVAVIDFLKNGKLKIIDYPQITIKGLTHWGGREIPESIVENAG